MGEPIVVTDEEFYTRDFVSETVEKFLECGHSVSELMEIVTDAIRRTE